MSAGLPNITSYIPHFFRDASIFFFFFFGAIKITQGGNENNLAINSNAPLYNLDFDASLSNPIYGNSDTVTPLSLSTKFFIKY